MLQQFLITHRKALIDRTRAKVSLRPAPRPTEEELTNGVPMFLTQLGEALKLEGRSPKADLFKQLGNDRTGMGLGLAISRRAVEESGGLLSVRDAPGKRCVFTLDLPRVIPAPPNGREHA